MDDLISGYRRFREVAWPERKQLFERLAARGQKPETLVIACSDSRVDPQMIFDAGPGQMFVVRNVANLVPPYLPDANYHGTSAAIEFAVRVLKVQDVIVMGHAQCGGVHALLEGAPPGAEDFVAGWMKIAEPARLMAEDSGIPRDQRQRFCEQCCVKLSLANLAGFPWVAERISAGDLKLHGAYFGVATGRLEMLDDDGTFKAV
ncbi:UNVERIFIED_ORG: carbonic anhydrase [Xanthobacter viscosus]|uniref:Carbonic anhydrase n=1 Tax=Xanthobacter autotrophicus TaxID=280 RepID=A0A6C1KLI4_XANAU|nr:carbonic anhydrase [Xanthobacter autotrophicus]TLX43944.1 carbonic anhydrase [Xanthobacter autotrophicus]